MTFSNVLHNELLWDFSFGVLGHGIITPLPYPSLHSTFSPVHRNFARLDQLRIWNRLRYELNT